MEGASRRGDDTSSGSPQNQMLSPSYWQAQGRGAPRAHRHDPHDGPAGPLSEPGLDRIEHAQRGGPHRPATIACVAQ